jgi:hypothetical protein
MMMRARWLLALVVACDPLPPPRSTTPTTSGSSSSGGGSTITGVTTTIGGTSPLLAGGGGCAGALALYNIDDASAYMQRLYSEANPKESRAAALGVRAEIDQWQDDGGRTRQDWYLASTDRAKLESYVTEYVGTHPLDGDHKLAIENGQLGARTYYILAKPIIDGTAIESAAASKDSVGRATVDVTLTADGAKTLESASSHNVGHKLAIVVGGTVMSAPVISAAIKGGKFSITIGGADAAKGDRDAKDLAAGLKCK